VLLSKLLARRSRSRPRRRRLRPARSVEKVRPREGEAFIVRAIRRTGGHRARVSNRQDAGQRRGARQVGASNYRHRASARWTSRPTANFSTRSTRARHGNRSQSRTGHVPRSVRQRPRPSGSEAPPACSTTRPMPAVIGSKSKPPPMARLSPRHRGHRIYRPATRSSSPPSTVKSGSPRRRPDVAEQALILQTRGQNSETLCPGSRQGRGSATLLQWPL